MSNESGPSPIHTGADLGRTGVAAANKTSRSFCKTSIFSCKTPTETSTWHRLELDALGLELPTAPNGLRSPQFLADNLLLCGDPCNDFFQAACPLSSSFQETLARINPLFCPLVRCGSRSATSKAFNRAFEWAFPSPKADTAASNLQTSVASAATTSGARLGGRGGDNYPVEWGWIFSFAAGHCSDLGLGPLRTLTHPDGTSNYYPRVGMTCPQIGAQKRDTKRTKTRSTHAG